MSHVTLSKKIRDKIRVKNGFTTDDKNECANAVAKYNIDARIISDVIFS